MGEEYIALVPFYYCYSFSFILFSNDGGFVTDKEKKGVVFIVELQFLSQYFRILGSFVCMNIQRISCYKWLRLKNEDHG